MGPTAITAGKLFNILLYILLMAYFIVKVWESFVKLDHEEWLMCVGRQLEMILLTHAVFNQCKEMGYGEFATLIKLASCRVPVTDKRGWEAKNATFQWHHNPSPYL